MIRRLFRRIRISLPPTWTVCTFLFCYLTAWMGEAACRTMLGQLDRNTLRCVVMPFQISQTQFAALAALLFGLWRVYAFHPLANPDYSQWLKQMPWTPGRPLPMGSVLPGAIDTIVVALLCWMAGTVWPASPIAPLLTYLVALTLAACIVAGFTRQRRVLYVILFGVGVAVRLAFNPFFSLVVLAILLPLEVLILRRSLEPGRWPKHGFTIGVLSDQRRLRSVELGWPFAVLGPWAHSRYVVWPHTLILALLPGWFLWAALSHPTLNAEQERGVVEIFSGVLVLLIIPRAFVWVIGHRAPISLFGRLATGRWIIPGYDRVFLACLLAVLAVMGGEIVLYRFAVPIAIGQRVVVSAWVYLLLAVGPSLRNWELTGEHRIYFPQTSTKSGPYVQV